MKALLGAIKTKLTTYITEAKKVQIIPDILLFDDSASFPIVGIIDAGEVYAQKPSHRLERLSVTVVVYQMILEPESSIINNASRSGVIDLIDDVEAQLKNERFATLTPIISDVAIKGKSGTIAIGNLSEPQDIVYKTMTLEYLRERLEA